MKHSTAMPSLQRNDGRGSLIEGEFLRGAVGRVARAPLVSGKQALLGAIVAIAIPTGVRAAMTGTVVGCEFTPYLPFVLLSAILLGWRAAAFVSLSAVAILGGLVGPANAHFADSCFLAGAGVFLGSSAMTIGTVLAIRWAIERTQSRIPDESSDGIIFSLEKDKVWASWPGHGAPLLLGTKQSVGEMMEDYLKQVKLGERLTGEITENRNL